MSKNSEKKPKLADKAAKGQSSYQSEKSSSTEKPAMMAKPGKKK